MHLKFYIIYTPNSFSKLKLAINSLLLNTDYHFILVANGLEYIEFCEIQDFISNNKRLDIIDLPGNVTIPHGTALNHLFNIASSDYFCFMDSDIFAFKDFSEQLNQLVKENDVVSSCKPLEWLRKKSPKGYRGHCTVSPSGKNIAMTYFAVYKRDKVRPVLNKYGISFERYMRKSQIPEKAMSVLSEPDKHTNKFNTAKLLNILQAYDGVKFAYKEFDGLVHLGGVSRYSEHTIQGTRNINKSNPVAVDRVATRYYFHNLLENIKNNCYELPDLSLNDTALENHVIETSHELILLKKSIVEAKTCH